MGMDPIFGSREPVIIGHRGCGRGIVDGCSENTLESFLMAIELGVEWLEVDVRRTADDILVVAHDPAEPDGVFYADITGDQAGDRGALRLEELLDALPADIGVDFDLKTSMEDATRERTATTAARLAPVASREARRRPSLVTSFDPGALDITRELAPGVPRGLLTWLDFPIDQAVAAAGHLDVQVLASHCGSLRPDSSEPEPSRRPLDYVVDIVHQSGREFLAWCPGPDFAEELVDAGADALCVNNVGEVIATFTAAVGGRHDLSQFDRQSA
jgi:glycerophosphoryl diester phosphodiesterase